MRTKIFVFLMLISLTWGNVGLALSVEPIAPPGTDSSPGTLLFGQEHAYSVVFRGNGEAIVYARMVVTNANDETMDTYSFQVSRVMPYEVAIYQQKISSSCVRYDTGNKCLQYQIPDYTGRYGRRSYAEYKKVEYIVNSNVYELSLPYPVVSGETTAIVVAYAAKGYVNKSLGLYRFSFETLRVPARISTVNVAVDVDSDLFLRGKKAQVDYDVPMTDMFMMPSASKGVSSETFDTMVGSIGAYGALEKQAKSLAPNETFIVNGTYSQSWFRLYTGSFVIAMVVIAGIIALAYWGSRFIAKRKKIQPASHQEVVTSGSASNQSRHFNPFTVRHLVAGLISVVCVALLTYGVMLLGRFNVLGGSREPIIQVFMVIAIGIAYIAAISGPAAIMQAKNGIGSMWSVFVAEFLWLVLFVILYLALFPQYQVIY